MSSGKRNKPKKADFIFNKKRYWINECTKHTDWFNGEYLLWSTYNCLEYESDKEETMEEFTDEQTDTFIEKLYKAGERIFPYTYGDWNFEF